MPQIKVSCTPRIYAARAFGRSENPETFYSQSPRRGEFYSNEIVRMSRLACQVRASSGKNSLALSRGSAEQKRYISSRSFHCVWVTVNNKEKNTQIPSAATHSYKIFIHFPAGEMLWMLISDAGNFLITAAGGILCSGWHATPDSGCHWM